MDGTQDIARRLANAEASFIDHVCEQTGCSRETGAKVLAFYRKLKILKIDAGIGRWQVTHGAYLDNGALRGAIADVEGEHNG